VISAASSFVYLEGITFYNGDESKGIIQYDAGHSGYHAADMLDVINYGVLGMVQPDLAVIAFGLNEYSQAFTSGATGTRTPSQMRADLYALVRQLRFQCVTPPSIVIAKMYPRGGSFVSPAPLSEYLAAYDDVVTMAGGDIATWDAGTVITDLASGNASGYGHTDLLHLTAAGHTAYAAGLTSFLTAA
jgi:lysophospholipase L1-like esterase